MTRLAHKLIEFSTPSYFRSYVGGLLLGAFIWVINIPFNYFMDSFLYGLHHWKFILAVFYTGFSVGYLLLFHPKYIGASWEFLLSHILNLLPSAKKVFK